jgi:hypothetical protein
MMRLIRNTTIILSVFSLLFAIMPYPVAYGARDSMADINYEVAESTKTVSEITIYLFESSLTLGSLLEVNGSIVPSPSNTVQVTLTYYQPGGTIHSIHIVNSTSTGSYDHTFSPGITGNWKVKASWEGDEIYEGAESETLLFKVNPPTLNVLLFFLAVGITYVVMTGFIAYRTSRRRLMSRPKPEG